MHESTGLINAGEDEQMEVVGFRRSRRKTLLKWIGYVLTCGLLRLVLHWFPQWRLHCTHTRCRLQDAEIMMFVEIYQGKHKMYYIKNVEIISSESSSPGGSSGADLQGTTFRAYLENGLFRELTWARSVMVKKVRYLWDDAEERLLRVRGLERGVTYVDAHAHLGLSTSEASARRLLYGLNEIVVPLQSILTLILLEVANAFYVFQVFTLIVWFVEGYVYYTIAIIIMSVTSVSTSVMQIRKNQRSLHNTVTASGEVTALRDGRRVELSATELVPGDVLCLPPQGCDVLCDAVLLVGACVVNESMLTGESVPVTKTPLPRTPGQVYDPKADANHTLFCGTKVLQTRVSSDSEVRAVVIRTGYHTAKGELVRSILYPPPADFRLERDIYYFFGILAFIATCGFLYTVILKSAKGISAGDIVIKALDIFTIVIPPALPAAMTMGKLYGQLRLLKADIYCINTRYINVSGSLDCICFDKTGTLTEDGLNMWGVLEVHGSKLSDPITESSLLPNGRMKKAMATCHSITLIDNKYMGDPLDIQMFEFTNWELENGNDKSGAEPETIAKPSKQGNKYDEDSPSVHILHQFQFSSTLQRMSVVTHENNSAFYDIYVKGSPEMIMSLSDKTTVPNNILGTLEVYTSKGYRVLAVGHCFLPLGTSLQKLSREDVEKNLTFMGIIIMENKLKKETTAVIEELKRANFRVIMITGDNIETASSVSRECGIVENYENIVNVTAIPPLQEGSLPKTYYSLSSVKPSKISGSNNGFTNHSYVFTSNDEEMGPIKNVHSYKFALTGTTWAILKSTVPDLLQRIIARGAIFARMSSDQKQQLVQELKDMNFCVSMCGDGANDCGALRAADVGISLSEAEASVASPFMSKVTNISCVPRVIREGRAALITAFGIFKFMVAYSLTEFWSTILLYSIGSNLTDLEFLFIDIGLIVNFATFFGRNGAYEGPLVRRTPDGTLYTPSHMLSLVLVMIVNILGQSLMFYVVTLFPWFVPHDYEKKGSYACHSNYVVFAVSMFQYITMAVVFSHGAPYRKPIYTNHFLVASLAISTVFCTYLTVYPAQSIMKDLELDLPSQYNIRVIILCTALSTFLISLFLEHFVIQHFIVKKDMQFKKTIKKHAKIEEEIQNDYNWPQLENTNLRNVMY